MYSGTVNWKKVNKTPNSIYKKIENCNYCVELGKQLKFSLVGIAGKDICDGNMKLSLGLFLLPSLPPLCPYFFPLFSALLSQVLQHYVLNTLKSLNKLNSKEVREDDLVRWVNERSAPYRITSFKDPSLSTALPLISLLSHILPPGSVKQELAQKGENKNECLDNAKYAISVARKAGARAFLVPEDIVEVNAKMILAFVGSLMSLQ